MRDRNHVGALFALVLLLVVVVAGGSSAAADSGGQGASELTSSGNEEGLTAAQLPDGQDVSQAIGEYEREEDDREDWLSTPEAENQRANSQLAFGDLVAGESEELLRHVFGEQLAALNEDPSRFLSDAPVIESLGESAAVVKDEGEGTLLEATVPLRTEDEDGELAKVDLSLEESPDGFETDNAVTDLVLPSSANEGIQIGEEDLEITQAGATNSHANRFGDKNLFYPAVLPDTDLFVAANSLGVELFDQLRSVESPEDLQFDISVPDGASLRSDEHGGAEVVRDGKQLSLVPMPSAVDAQGTQVPMSLEVTGSSINLHVDHRNGDFAYPILVDPIVEDWVNQNSTWYNGYNWGALSNGAWQWTSNNSSISHDICCWEGSHAGLLAWTQGNVFYGSEQYGQWSYSTPNSHVLISHIWMIPFNRADFGCTSSQPHDYAGVWSANGVWSPLRVNYAKEHGTVSDDSRGEALIIGVSSGPPGVWISCPRILYAGGVGIWLDDEDLPQLSTTPTAQWMDKSPVRLAVSATDAGIGVKSFEAWATNSAGATSTWTTTNACTGLYGARCPHTWNLGDGSQPALSYDPSVLPEGIDKLSVKASDATGKPSSTTNVMTIRVDHSAPSLSLSGTVTEQVKLGTELPSYTLLAKATDGVPGSEKEADVRSGVTKLTFQENGQYVVSPWEKSCAGQSCGIEQEIEIPAYKLPAGSHTVVVKATDALGHVATKEVNFNTGDKQAPALGVSGMPSEAAGATYADYWSSFGSLGSGIGKFSMPAGAAVDVKGNLWVADRNNQRVEKFNEAGEYLSAFGAVGTGNGQFTGPTDVAIDAKANLWVTDAGNSRLEEFNESGGYVTKVGSLGSGSGQFNHPESIAIDSKGNIWVADTGNGRLQEFNANGAFIRVASSKGAGQGQLGEPTGIAIGPANTIWVADASNNRVSVFNESGGFMRQFGTSGSGNGQFSHPGAIEVDTQGDVWVGDQNSRVQEFNQSGEYVGKFGSPGSGKGQLSGPLGIAADSKGSLWVSDSGNNRVERWLAPNATVSGQVDPITASATDPGGFGVTSVTAKITNEAGVTETLGEIAQACAKGQCPLVLNVPEPDLSEEAAGAYLVTFSATDGAGNARKLTKVLGVDPTEPVIALSGTLADRASKPLNAASGQLSIKASDPGGSGVKMINVERDDQRVASYPFSCPGNCGEVTASYRYSAARDGTERSIQKSATPSGATQTSLGGVSCLSVSNCLAIGYYKNSSGTIVTLAERWDGTEWKIETTPNRAGAENRLEGVSCTSSSNCVAVGKTYYPESGTSMTLVERWLGSSWSIVSSPNPAGLPKLQGVACVSSSDCWAVGSSPPKPAEEAEGKKSIALIEHWNGSAWSISALAEPPTQLKRVSCASATSCVAVTGVEGLSVERWNGSAWSPQAVAAPPGGSGGALKGISCSAASECMAVGSYLTSNHTAPLAERWNGSAWAVQATVDPKGIIEEGVAGFPVVGALEGVSCTSATSCTASGGYRNSVLQTQPLVESWDGTEWALQPAPAPSSSPTATASDISCSVAFDCTGVGYAGSASPTALIEGQTASKDSHRVTVEAIGKYGATAVQAIDVDVPVETPETPACSQNTTSVAPKEPVTAGQAISSIESSLPQAVAPSIPTLEETTENEINPSYTAPQPNLEATGNLAQGETSVTPKGGVTLVGIACITPSTLTTAVTQASVVHGDSAVFANTAPETSTIVRPTAGGVNLMQAINGPNAPDSFSWNVTVPVGTELEELPSGAIAVVRSVEEVSGGVAELLEPENAQAPSALNDAATQLERDEYQLATAQAETNHEVLAVIAEPWIILRTGEIVPVQVEVAPVEEIPTEYVIQVIMPSDENQGQLFPAVLSLDEASASTVSGTCVGASPCGEFDTVGATLYATFWGDEGRVNTFGERARNPYYHNYGDNNCTNFLSQIVRAGNGKFMRAFDHGDGSWWYHNNFKGGQRFGPEGYGWDTSESWRFADKFPRHLWQYGLAHIDSVQEPWGWTRGDILGEDWFGTAGVGDFNHLQFVVGTTEDTGHAREPLIANESSPGSNYPHLKWRFVKERIQRAEPAGWTRVALAMKHTKANLHDKKHDPDNLYGPNGLFNG